MLRTSRLVAFAATTDGTRARAFYEGVLGLDVVSDDDFALVLDADGTMLRIQKVAELSPASFTTLGWSVSDLEASISTLQERGVSFTRYEGLEQDELGIWRSPRGAFVAWFKDPDGNLLSLTQH